MKIIANALRGALIGLAELVPGVSGGTIALVTGIYEHILEEANRFLDAIKNLFKDRHAAKLTFKRVDWLLLIPLAVGMLTAVVTMAGVMESFVTDQPIISRALFFGMVIISIAVPLQMTHKDQVRDKIWFYLPLFLLGALATFFLTGVTSAPQDNPNYLVVFLAAAVAVCALVLPGVSGSFFLLAVGLYSATMGAIHDRNVAYIGVFALGAITGIVLFVRLLEKLLNDHRNITLVIMAGLMLGSLRALWPWQDGQANLLAPGEQLPAAIGLAIVGAVGVSALIFADRVFSKKTASQAVNSNPEHTA